MKKNDLINIFDLLIPFSLDCISNSELMWKQSVWTSLIAAKLASLHLKEGGLVALTGAKAALEGTPGIHLIFLRQHGFYVFIIIQLKILYFSHYLILFLYPLIVFFPLPKVIFLHCR